MGNRFVLGHPLFFCLPSNAFPDIGSVGRIEKKKNPKKKIISILGIGGLVPRHHSCGARKTTRREPKINMAEKLADVVAKLRQRGKKDQPQKNGLKTSLTFFFLENAQSVGRRETEKKKGMALELLGVDCIVTVAMITLLHSAYQLNIKSVFSSLFLSNRTVQKIKGNLKLYLFLLHTFILFPSYLTSFHSLQVM